MKYPKKQQGKYAYLEQLTTEELDELLRLEFNADEEDADPELVLAIMEVIAEREPEDIPPIDPEETWKTFRQREAISERKASIWKVRDLFVSARGLLSRPSRRRAANSTTSSRAANAPI